VLSVRNPVRLFITNTPTLLAANIAGSGGLMLNLCDICGCEYQYKHGCGDTCFCEICPECEGNAKECGCNAGTMTNRKEVA